MIGKRNGFGVYKSKRGSRYEGQWADDVRSGLGNMTFTTPSLDDKSGEDNSKWAGSYDGQWENNLKHGKGVFLYENGDKYDGSWKEGKKCGFGKYTYANGDRYEGEFHADNMHGVGVFLNSEGHASGRWQNDVRIGRFVVTNSQGTFEEIYDTKGSMTSRNKLNLDGK